MPTMMVPNCQNIEVWAYMWEIAMDIGQKFTKRIEFYLSGYIALYSMYLAFMLLLLFKFIDYEVSTEFWLISMCDLLIIFVITIWVLNCAASVNAQFDEHIGAFKGIKWILYKVQNDHEALAKRTAFADKQLHVMTDIFEQRKERWGEDKAKSDFEKAITQIDLTIEQLDYDKEFKPLKILGFKITNSFMNNLYTFILSLVFTLGQFFFADLFTV